VLHLGAIASAAFVFGVSVKLTDFYTCHDGLCSFGVFTDHMRYTFRFVYITSYLSVFFNCVSFGYLVSRAFSSRVFALSKHRLAEFVSTVSYMFAVTLSALVCGAIFSSDFVRLTDGTTASGRDLKRAKLGGILLFVFQFLTHCTEVW
jgi:hypothetical protein